MQGHQHSRTISNRLRSGVAGLLLGGAASCLLAAPASAQGVVEWSGPYASIGIGATIMDADTKVNAARNEQTNIDIQCPPVGLGCLIPPLPPDGSISASIFPLAQQQNLNLDGLTDAGVSGHLSLGWDQRITGSNFLIGAFFDYNFYNVSAEFRSQVWAEGGRPSISFNFNDDPVCPEELCLEAVQEVAALDDGGPLVAGIIGGIIGASVLNAIRDEHIEIDGKIEQDYSIAVGGRIGYILNEAFMTYFGAAWTRTSIDGHVNVNIADPFCGPGSICDGLNSPTSIRLDLDEEVDGYKLLIGGEYALGQAMGGSWFLRGQAEYHDYDGITKSFSGSRNQQIINFEGFECGNLGCLVAPIDVARQISESASASIDKEDYSVYGALVYKLGGFGN